MTICLTCGSIGVSADQLQAIDLAQRHGFESVEPYPEYLASLSEERLHEVLASLKQHGLVFGAAGLPVDFRQDDARFQAGLKALPRLASGLQLAGAQRVGTWLAPGHATLTYRENFRQHTARLRAVAEILKDRGLRLGLEYVGTRSLRARTKFSFVRTLKETQELIAEIGSGNVGLVLDSWHWWMAADTETDILGLRPEQVVSVDLNDAPAGVSMDQQVDGRRELPLATGVIDVAGFLRALNQIGYDGPVRAEPFNKALNELNNEEACAATAAAMKKAFALL
jgi:sugar phosphate isomerase/epimerase